MCGIAGKIVRDGVLLSRKELVDLRNSLRHRGPDGWGEYIDDRVGLTMRRLAIIDVKGGDQPLYNEDKSLVIIGNGEIYNYKELSRILLRRGHKLSSGSDIETVLHLYEDYGLLGIKKLRGMFALALYDKKRQKVILIRDRMGEKPLYWTSTAEGLVFASEMKALIKTKGLSRKINEDAIDKYFHYYYVPEPETMIKGINKLPAGSMLIVDLKTQKIELKKYWDPDKIVPIKSSNPAETIKRYFQKACEFNLRADVPVGISLSGGVDSGSILAVSAPKYKRKLIAFCIGYEGRPSSDERRKARLLAKKFKVKFFEAEIRVSEVVKNFPKLVWDMDDPIADIAGYSIYMVSNLARSKGVPVLLGGIGGDELFWGYTWMAEAVKKSLKEKRWYFYRQTFGFRIADLIVKRLYAQDFKNKISASREDKQRFSKWSRMNLSRKAMSSIRDFWLKGDVIALGDRLSMAASVELRSPFLDHKLVEQVLLHKQTVTGYEVESKYWFKKAMSGLLPPEVLQRPKKGFTPPVKIWVGRIIQAYIHLFKDGFLEKSGVIKPFVLSVLRVTWPVLPMFWYQLYQLVLLEVWGREYIWRELPSDIKPRGL